MKIIHEEMLNTFTSVDACERAVFEVIVDNQKSGCVFQLQFCSTMVSRSQGHLSCKECIACYKAVANPYLRSMNTVCNVGNWEFQIAKP